MTLEDFGFDRVMNSWETWKEFPEGVMTYRVLAIAKEYPNWQFIYNKTWITDDEETIVDYRECDSIEDLVNYLKGEFNAK